MSLEQETETTHLPETIQEAMAEEARSLAERDPETAAALQEAARTERRMTDPLDLAEQEATNLALQHPRQVTPPENRGRPRTRATNSRSTSRSSTRKTNQSTAFDEDTGRARTAGGALEQLADAAQKGARRAGAPREDDWAEFLAILFGFLSMLFVWWLISDVRGSISKQERDDLELNEDEAEGLARPAARILARSWLNDTYGKHIMGASDYIVMMVVLTAYAERVTPAVQRKLKLRRPTAPREERATQGRKQEPQQEQTRERERPPQQVVEEPTQGPGGGPQQWPIFGAQAT